MNDDPRDVPLETLLATFGEGLRRSMFTSEPGRIVDYDATTRRASVLLANQRSHVDAQRQVIVETVSQVHNIPVVFLGAPGRAITWPVKVGDDCLLWFASSSIARWKATGRPGDPGDTRTHDINDCFAMVCPFFGQMDAPTDAIVTQGLTRIGGSDANDAVVVQSALTHFLDALVDAIGAAAPNDGGRTALTQLQTSLGAWAAGTTLAKAK